jgi:hypothetical protein
MKERKRKKERRRISDEEYLSFLVCLDIHYDARHTSSECLPNDIGFGARSYEIETHFFFSFPWKEIYENSKKRDNDIKCFKIKNKSDRLSNHMFCSVF